MAMGFTDSLTDQSNEINFSFCGIVPCFRILGICFVCSTYVENKEIFVKTRFFVYQVGNRFVKIHKLTNRMTLTNLNNASYWEEKTAAKSWEPTITKTYPNAKRKNAELAVVEK